MIKKAKTLETGYYTCTDNGYLTNVLKAYNYAKKNDLKLIAGCELYFYDNELFAGTESERIKYFTVTVHAKTQEAYQFLVKKMSDQNKPTIKVIDQEYPLFDWKDLKEFSERDFTVTNGGPQCIISKHLLVDNKKAAFETFKRLHEYFGKNFYASIMPHKFDRKWYASSVFTFTDGVEVELDSNIMAETDYAKTFRVPLKEVAENHTKHGGIKKVYVNGIGYDVNKNILSCINLKKFKKIDVDIYETYNRFIKSMSERYGVKTIINDYSYFSNKDDKLVQDMKLGDDIRFAVNHHICRINEVYDTLSNIYVDLEIEQMIQNSYEWASNFDNFKLEYNYRLVKEHDDSLKATMDLIKELGRFDKSNPEHIKHLKHELDVIHSNGIFDFLPYFFPIAKVLKFYRDNGKLPGPARGSAGGSFLLYCMGITEVNPLKYGLYFSRFLTPGRIRKGTMPDVDVDLPDRDLLVNEGGFFDTHYNGRWSQISTRTLMKLKSAVRDVNRYKHGKVEEEIEKFAKNLEATPQGVSDADFVFGYEDNDGNHVEGLLDKDENLQKYVKERPEEWEIVKRTLGISRQNGRHACAFVLSDVPITEVIPTMKVGDMNNVTQYEAKEVEAAGMIKYDFLIISCLKDIQLAIEKINKKHFYENGNKGGFSAGEFFHKGDITYIWDLPEEQEVFDMLSDGKTETVFQLNTTSVTPFVKRIKPKSVEDCAVITSLVRPGPLDFVDERTGRNMAEEYIERVNGRSQGDIQILNDMLPETHGVFVFQEQITKLTKKLTGWDDEKAEDVRIAVGKKKIKMIQELRPQFIQAAVEKGFDEGIVTNVWGMIETFGRYGFNKSHAVAYAMIAYACAYLKHHYPLEWWAAVLSNADDKEITEVLWPHVKDILSPPDINLSEEEIVIDYDNGTLRSKLSVLKGIGEKAANKITDGRPYKNIGDFVQKQSVGHSLTKKLINVGVLDSLFPPKSSVLEKMKLYENAREEYKYKKKIFEKSEGEIPMDLPLGDFIEKAKNHPKTKRCQHKIKEGRVDSDYGWMDPIDNYLLKKSVFPNMLMNLHDILSSNPQKTRIIKADKSCYAIAPDGREVRFVSGSVMNKIKNLDHNPISKQIINYAVCGYVIDTNEFTYHETKKAFKIIVDIDSYLEEFVIWPDRETGVLSYPENLKKNSIVTLFLQREMKKERYHTNINYLIVEKNG